MPVQTDLDRIPEEWSPLFRIVTGYMPASLIAVTLRLGLPDRLAGGARGAKDLADETGTHERSLTRLLRALASLAVTEEVEPGVFRLTETGALLRTDAPGPMRPAAMMFSEEAKWTAWGQLEYSIRTGKPAYNQVTGMDYFTDLAGQPALYKPHQAAMREGTKVIAAEILQRYDFSPYQEIVDVGGGDGTLLAAILAAYPGQRGTVYDSPGGLEGAPETLQAAGVADRCQTAVGDFFASVPGGGDLYVLKSIVHDWADERAAVILRNCRKAMRPTGKLLIVEVVLPNRVDLASTPPFAYMSDMNMLVVLGGAERTESEFGELLGESGFALASVTPLPGPARMSLIEAVPA